MKLPRLKRNDPVEVLWVDILQDPSWQSSDVASESQPALCRSLGYYLNCERGCLRISESLNKDLDQRSVQIFPLGVVLKVRKLR